MNELPDGQPIIEMTHDRVFCDRHAQPFRENWPDGFLTFALSMWEELGLMDCVEETIEEARVAAEAALDEKPMCCHLPRERLLEIMMGARRWRKGLCRNCKKLGPWRLI